MYEQYRLCSRENQPKLLTPAALLWLMALTLGGIAIWTMHFVAMFSISIKDNDGNVLSVSYRLDYTFISLIAVIMLSYVGLRIGSSDQLFKSDKNDAVTKFTTDARNMTIKEIKAIKNIRIFLLSTLTRGLHVLLAGGLVTGGGVCVMHYVGMMAIVFDGTISWNGGIVTASVIIAVVAATAAFWILYRLLSFFPKLEVLRIACSFVAALAVNGMHYTGQSAATFTYRANRVRDLGLSDSNLVPQSTATSAAIVIAVIICFVIFILALSDLRVWVR